MTLRDRAAAALDETFHIENLGLETAKVRAIVAAWLDGQKIRTKLVRNSCAYLEMIARSARA